MELKTPDDSEGHLLYEDKWAHPGTSRCGWEFSSFNANEPHLGVFRACLVAKHKRVEKENIFSLPLHSTNISQPFHFMLVVIHLVDFGLQA